MSHIKKFLSKDQMIRAAAVVSTPIIQEMIERQNANPLASLALGRLGTGALLLAAQLKKHQKIGIDINGDGPLGRIFAEADFEGHVRAVVTNPQGGDGSIESLGAAVGAGTLTVHRSQPNSKEPHKGTIEIVSGEIGDDLAHYLHQSQQIASVVALATVLNKDGTLKESAGIILEVLPNASSESISKLEEAANQVTSFANIVAGGANAYELCELYLSCLGFYEIPHNQEIQFRCTCSSKRMARSVALMGAEEVGKIEKAGESLTGRCEFCGATHTITPEEVSEALRSLSTLS